MLWQVLVLAAGDMLGNVEALTLEVPLPLRMLLSVPALVAVPEAHVVAEVLMSGKLAVGARENDALSLTEAVLLTVGSCVPLALELS